MRSIHAKIIAACLILLFAGCGGSDNNLDTADLANSNLEKTASKTAGKEKNILNVEFSNMEQYSPGTFELKKTLGYISGMRYNAKSTAKLVYIAFANYDPTLGPYSVNVPKEPGQIVIVLSFKTENKEIPLEQQMDEYAKMAVPTGTYEPAWMGEGQCFQVYYFVGGEEGGPPISDQGASGTATLTTSTPKQVSGRIDFRSPNGTTIKGTFNVKITKELWKN